MFPKIRTKTIGDILRYLFCLALALLFYNVFTIGLTKIFILQPNILIFRLISTFSQVITLCILYFVYKPLVAELGFHWDDSKKSIKTVTIVGYSMLIVLIVSSYFIMGNRSMFALITNLHFGLSTPIFEEIIFRGYWWEKFTKKYKSTVVIFISTISFSLFHFGYYYIIEYSTLLHTDAPEMIRVILIKVGIAFLFGLVLSILRSISKTVNIPILAHGILNIIGD